MPTSDDRREVAARLRDIDCRCAVFDDPYRKLCRDMGGALGYSEENDIGMDAFAKKLADLIDPTCEMVVKDGHACCGRCGHRLADECEVEEGYYEFRPFCPDCGARVTDGGRGLMAEHIVDTADGVFNAKATGEIVRCRDCESERPNPLVGCGHICEYFGFPLPDFDGGCAWGERR